MHFSGTRWREGRPTSMITGRKLTTLVDMYVEERRRGRIISPEYLSKLPCGFEVTELVLKQILVCYAETKRHLYGIKSDEGPVDVDTQASIYLNMIQKWHQIHPEIRLTVKQIISIHHMLNFEPGKDDPSPFIVCHLTESLRKMDRDVPENRRINSEFDEKFDKIDHDDSFDFEDNVDYDEDNLSMEQLQELFLATQEIQKGVLVKRPKFVTKKLKYFWNEKRVQDLTIARRFAMEKFKMDKKSSFGHHFYKYWKKLNPGIEVKKSQVLARHNFQIRFEKKMLNQKVDKVIKHWENMCNDYRVNEENIEVIDESLNIKTELDLIKVSTIFTLIMSTDIVRVLIFGARGHY